MLKAISRLTFLFVVLYSTSACAVESALDGRYVRITRSFAFQSGGQESGELILSNSTKKSANFKLGLSWTLHPEEDGAAASLGTIDNGEISLSRSSGMYISRENGTISAGCEIKFVIQRDTILLTQRTKCSWFGLRIDASGLYVKTKDNAVVLVR
jgi:hypothetical protein